MPATWLDHLIGYFAPGAGERRLIERAKLEARIRSYAGANKNRQSGGWTPKGASANAELSVSLPALRNRMRDLVRNNPHAAKAVSTIVVHAIGTGIVPRAKTGNKGRDRKIMAEWDTWTKSCHSKGLLDFYGLQTLVCREFIEAGEVLIRKRIRRGTSAAVPLELQVLEADLLDTSRDGPVGNGVTAYQGIEQDASDRPSGYWLFPRHPGDSGTWSLEANGFRSLRVPAAEIAHVFEMRRDQSRGEPWGVAAIAGLRDLDDYRDSEMMRKKIEACAVGVVTGGDETDMGVGIPLDDSEAAALRGVYDSSGATVDRFEPGMFLYARGGKQITFNSPAATGSYEAYKRASLQDIAAGFRVPYELLSGDLAHVSYISGRLGLQEFYRLVEVIQWQILVPAFCQRVWDWFCEVAYTAGKIPLASVPVEWAPPRMPAVDPMKQAMADVIDLRAGLRSHAEIVQERGRPPSDVLAEIAEFNAAVDAAGIVLDSDPRKVAKSGASQVAEAVATDPGTPGGRSEAS
ncbi:hypothetical protein ABB55_08520 [Prosthecomicrobium hirschii]|uniref:Portal protein n=1 Tax=Prosthecodimorpha hirschii TaxID=665126 RepID=A0A0P6VZV0_9HYPH|nr:phage portal protein [Prosthecomicrobium hirschii]KPL52270.1 hypothetical protein ABB55_08520 [Prosthecomicrobium hirschii]